MSPHIEAVHRSSDHSFSKQSVDEVELVAGIGVVGDAHSGARVQHRSRVKADPLQPNLRQVHLIHGELLDDLEAAGHEVRPGDLGENLTTRGIDLLDLPTGTVLRFGGEALLALTGLRNPCGQIEGFQSGLLEHVRNRDPELGTIRRAGAMSVVLQGGTIRPGDPIEIALPPGEPMPMRPI